MILNGRYKISPQQVESFEKDGYLLLDDLLDGPSIEEIVEWTSEVKSWPNKPGQHMPYEEERADGTVGLCRTENYARYHPGFGSLFRSERLTGLLSELIGEEAVLFKEKINYKEAGGSGGFDAHIDATAYTHAGAINHLTFLLAVDDMNLQNGCLEVVPGSHRETIPLGDNKLSSSLHQAGWEESQTWVPVPCEAGTFLIFGSCLAHRSGPNTSPRPRAAIYATYNGVSEGDKHDSYYEHRRKEWPPTSERVEGVDYTSGAITYAFGSPMTGGKVAIEAHNQKKLTAEKTVNELFNLIKAQGDQGYIGENISQLEHSLQVAQLASRAGSDQATITAALLHDIGQFLPLTDQKEMIHEGISVGRRSHDAIGEAYLQKLGFPATVCRLVGGHVIAKRYLTGASPDYLAKLSNASVASLKHQGGPFTKAQQTEFEKDPLHDSIVQLRLWDDMAKVEDFQVPDLESYRSTVVDVLLRS